MRYKIRKIMITVTFLLLPVVLNFLSPYVSIDGAMVGIISGSVILFVLMFLGGIFFGRAWCSWLCPMAGLFEMAQSINNKNVNVKVLKIIRYSIFTLWFATLVIAFILAGGIKGINPLHLTENFVSIDEPKRYIMYYIIVFSLFILTISIGKRGACQSICWMSPFMELGYRLGKVLRIPQLRVVANDSSCTNCGVCTKKCPMSIDVKANLKCIETSACILCGECIDNCPKKVLSFTIYKKHL